MVLLLSGFSSSGSHWHTKHFSLTAGFIIDVMVYPSEDSTDLSVKSQTTKRRNYSYHTYSHFIHQSKRCQENTEEKGFEKGM